MKKEGLFESFMTQVPEDLYEEVSLNIDIANHISDLLKERKMTQREFAARMGKKESEISRWLTGAHGFSTKTLAKIGHVLGEPVIRVAKKEAMTASFNYKDCSVRRLKPQRSARITPTLNYAYSTYQK